MVYCLSNDTNNFEFDECSRRGIGGIIRIPRPLSIANYNKYMGGVDLADMCQLHCNSTIMCQNRWWLKLFFYLLDVGMLNALVLYNKSSKMRITNGTYAPMNMVDFKMQLVEGLVGRWIDSQSGQEQVVEHVPVHIQGGICSQCAYFSLLSRTGQTRYKCIGCGVPLCSIGNGKVEDNCFAQAHKPIQRQDLACKKYMWQCRSEQQVKINFEISSHIQQTF
jgi:Transposase IS4